MNENTDEMIRQAKRDYMRNYMRSWREKNKGKQKQNEDNFWLRQAKLQIELRCLEEELEQLKEQQRA
jgi:hypothetical protein